MTEVNDETKHPYLYAFQFVFLYESTQFLGPKTLDPPRGICSIYFEDLYSFRTEDSHTLLALVAQKAFSLGAT